MVMLVKPEFVKQYSPIEPVFEISAVVNDEQSWNALPPISVTEFPMVMLVKPEFLKHPSPIDPLLLIFTDLIFSCLYSEYGMICLTIISIP